MTWVIRCLDTALGFRYFMEKEPVDPQDIPDVDTDALTNASTIEDILSATEIPESETNYRSILFSDWRDSPKDD